MALLINLHPSFFFTHEWRVSGSASRGELTVRPILGTKYPGMSSCIYSTEFGKCPILSTMHIRFCPSTFICARFCPRSGFFFCRVFEKMVKKVNAYLTPSEHPPKFTEKLECIISSVYSVMWCVSVCEPSEHPPIQRGENRQNVELGTARIKTVHDI